MIFTIDWETYDGIKHPSRKNAFLGSLCKENGETLFFRKGSDMWDYIKSEGRKLNRNGKSLIVYAFNMRDFDWYCFGDRNDFNLIDKSDNFFMKCLVETQEMVDERLSIMKKGNRNKREYVTFLDHMAIMARMSSIGEYSGLKGVGDLLGYPKLDCPEYLNDMTPKLIKENPHYLDELKVYCERDSKIIIESIKKIKCLMKEDKVFIRNLYSISGIAIKYLMNFLKKHPDGKKLFINDYKGLREFYPSINRFEIEDEFSHKMPFARGGRVQTIQTGKFKNCVKIDKNSYYMWSASKIRIPDLKTENRIKNPLNFIDKEILFDMIGFSQCKIRIPDGLNIGFLQVRDSINSGNPNLFPTKGTLYGQWTNAELKYAETLGYIIEDIEFSVVWQDLEYESHPFKDFVEMCYKKRFSGSKFNEWFYKMIGNGFTGKLNQYLPQVKIIRTDYNKHLQLLEKGWEISYVEEEVFLMKKTGEFLLKPYYSPIIYASITADARIDFDKELRKLKPEQILTMDTDGIILKDITFTELYSKFKIGKGLGEFKIENPKDSVGNFKYVNCEVFSNKTYKFGSNIKIAGVTRRDMDNDQWESKEIKYYQRISEKTAKSKDEIGTLKPIITNLEESQVKLLLNQKSLDERSVFFDNLYRGKYRFN